MPIFFVFLCQQSCKKKLRSENFFLSGDRFEKEHALYVNSLQFLIPSLNIVYEKTYKIAPKHRKKSFE
jgi:hypothetical protein